MTKPIPDKAEVALEYPDKLYIGTFERTARFDAHLDENGISLSLYRTGRGGHTEVRSHALSLCVVCGNPSRSGENGIFRAARRCGAPRGIAGWGRGSLSRPRRSRPDKETPDKEALAKHVILGRRFAGVIAYRVPFGTSQRRSHRSTTRDVARLYRSFLVARRAASPVAWLNCWRGTLISAKRRRSSGSVSKSASTNISTVPRLHRPRRERATHRNPPRVGDRFFLG